MLHMTPTGMPTLNSAVLGNESRKVDGLLFDYCNLCLNCHLWNTRWCSHRWKSHLPFYSTHRLSHESVPEPDSSPGDHKWKSHAHGSRSECVITRSNRAAAILPFGTAAQATQYAPDPRTNCVWCSFGRERCECNCHFDVVRFWGEHIASLCITNSV